MNCVLRKPLKRNNKAYMFYTFDNKASINSHTNVKCCMMSSYVMDGSIKTEAQHIKIRKCLKFWIEIDYPKNSDDLEVINRYSHFISRSLDELFLPTL